MSTLTRADLAIYCVTLNTPNGQAKLDVPSFLGPDAASRRAYFTAAALGWGDLDEIAIVRVEPLDRDGEVIGLAGCNCDADFDGERFTALHCDYAACQMQLATARRSRDGLWPLGWTR